MIDDLVIELKEEEGFSETVYKDTEGFDTIWHGTKLPLTARESKVVAVVVLRMRLIDKIEHLSRVKPVYKQLPLEVQSILANMAYQMGVGGLLKFTETWKYLENHDFKNASIEMLDSVWYRQMHDADMKDGTDSVNRAERLSARMAKC